VAYVGNQPARGQWRKLSDISSAFDGVITTFTTSVPPGTSEYFVTAGSASQLLISLGGVIQEPDVDYTVSTNSVTFTTPPTSGLSFFGVLCGDALNTGVPADGSVTTSKLAGGLSVGLTGGSASNPSLFFTGDNNTGVFSAGADQLNIATNSVERVEFGTSEVVFNDGGANYDFRIEGDTNSSLFFVDASAEAVGIGTTSPGATLDVSQTSSGATVTSLFLRNPAALAAGTVSRLAMTAVNTGSRFAYIDAGVTGAADNGHFLAFGTNPAGGAPTEKMRLTTDGKLLVGTTTATANGGVLELSGGITFPATAVAASNANTLDDYEEGTWTPTVEGSSTAGTVSYSFRNGKYTKIGNVVNFSAYLGWSGGTGTGNLWVAGLPFTPSTGSTFPACSLHTNNLALNASNVATAYVENSSGRINFYQYPVGGGGSAQVAYDAAVSELFVAGFYQV
jgi:hypothetical protein